MNANASLINISMFKSSPFVEESVNHISFLDHSVSSLLCWQWKPQDGKIKHATYSCDGGLIYAALTNRSIVVLAAISSEKTLQMRCLINPSAYLHSDSEYVTVN